VIFASDIIPVFRNEAISEIKNLCRKYASEMQNLGTSQEWMKQIASENMIVCQYKPLDPVCNGQDFHRRNYFHLSCSGNPGKESLLLVQNHVYKMWVME